MLTTKALQAPVKPPTAPFSYKPAPMGTVASPPVSAAGSQVQEDTQQTSPVRKLAFYFGLGFVFVVFSVLAELTYYITGMNTYVIYFFAPAAVLGALFTGGIGRTLRHRAAWYWLAFYLWMVVGVPFSYWRGGSTPVIYDYARISMTLLLVVGGLATNWREVRAIFYTVGMAGLVNLLTAGMFSKEENGRLNMTSSGTIGNSNDLAAHLLLVLPFMLFISMDRKRSYFVRYAMLPPIAYGVWTILGTASRGALIALSAVFLFMLLRATFKQRMIAAISAVVLAAIALTVLPAATLNRLGTLFGEEHAEAEESTEARSYLFQTSVRYTFEHPIFGVGLGQFQNFEGQTSVAAGKIGNWHATHCAWTQVSSECGIPALIFFVLGIGSALLLVYRTWRQALARSFPDIANACFCYLIAMVGFLIAITFLANAYRFYLPAMIGLAISMCFVAKRQMSAKATDIHFPGMIPRQPIAVR